MEYRIDFGGTEEGGGHSLPLKSGITSERTNSRKPACAGEGRGRGIEMFSFLCSYMFPKFSMCFSRVFPIALHLYTSAKGIFVETIFALIHY